MTYEVRVDCPSCLVEGTRIEVWDGEAASCRLGVAESARCRLCGLSSEGFVSGASSVAPGGGCPSCGSELDDLMREAHRCPFCGAHAASRDIVGATPVVAIADLDRALSSWAREEGLATAAELIEAYFTASSAEEIFAALSRGERVETTFDVADYLFSGGGGAGSGEPVVMRLPEEAPPSTQRTPGPQSIRRVGGPREEMLALASVAAADGEASPDDQAVLLRAAQKRNIPPLHPMDVRVWRPNEVDPPPTLADRERVLEEMFQMAWADGQMDESELRVIRDYSRAWGIDPERLKEWIELYSFGESNRLERWFRRVGFFLFPGK